MADVTAAEAEGRAAVAADAVAIADVVAAVDPGAKGTSSERRRDGECRPFPIAKQASHLSRKRVYTMWSD